MDHFLMLLSLFGVPKKVVLEEIPYYPKKKVIYQKLDDLTKVYMTYV